MRIAPQVDGKFMSAFIRAKKAAGNRRGVNRRKDSAMSAHYNVLFLCTGNSARSIMAEAILNRHGQAELYGLQRRQPSFGGSAARGAETVGACSSADEWLAQQELGRVRSTGRTGDGFRLHGLRQRREGSLSRLAGQPMTAHWGVADPAAVTGTPDQIERAFREAFVMLDRRIRLFLALPLATLGKLAIQREIDQIGKQQMSPRNQSPRFSRPVSDRLDLRSDGSWSLVRMAPPRHRALPQSIQRSAPRPYQSRLD